MKDKSVKNIDSILPTANNKTQNLDRHQGRVNKTKKKLLSSAKAVFSEKGYDLTTIDDITDRADVGKGTFYNHFKNKEILICELNQQIVSELTDCVFNIVKSKDSLEKVLESIIQVHMDFFKNRREDYILFFQSRADLTLEESYKGIESPFVNYLSIIEKVITNTIHKSVSKDKIKNIACGIAGFVSGYYSFALMKSNAVNNGYDIKIMQSALVVGLTNFVKEAVS